MNTTNSQLPPDVQARIEEKQMQKLKYKRRGIHLARWGWLFFLALFLALAWILRQPLSNLRPWGEWALIIAVYLLSALIFPQRVKPDTSEKKPGKP